MNFNPPPPIPPKPLCVMVKLALSGLLLSAAASVTAQTPAIKGTADAAPVIEEVLVTGSCNIRRALNDGVVPVSVIGEEAMEVRSALLPVDLPTSLPSVVNLPENETRLGSSGARGDNANINLRNMGATAALVLVNGRRMAINPMTAGLSQAVNVNQLPTQGVDRIEVLRKFDGIEASLQQGGTEHGSICASNGVCFLSSPLHRIKSTTSRARRQASMFSGVLPAIFN